MIDSVKKLWSRNFFCGVFLAIVFPLLYGILTWCFVEKTHDYLYSRTDSYLKEITRKNAYFIEQYIERNLSKLQDASDRAAKAAQVFSSSEILKFFRDEKIVDIFEAIRVVFVDKKGAAKSSDGFVADLSQRNYFKKALAGSQNVSNIFHDIWGSERINVYAVPLRRSGKIVGVVAVTQNADVFSEMLQNGDDGGESFFYVVGHDATIISRSNHHNNFGNGKNLVEILVDLGCEKDVAQKIVKNMNDKVVLEGVISFELQGRLIHLSYAKISFNDWYVVSIVPDTIVADWKYIIRNICIAAAILGIMLEISFLYILCSTYKNVKNIKRILYTDKKTGYDSIIKSKIDADYILSKTKKNEKYSLIRFNINNFRLFNEIYGYAEGDRLLCLFATALNTTFSGDAIIWRYFADHFGVLVRFESRKILNEYVDRLYRRILKESRYSQVEFLVGVFVARGGGSFEAMGDRALMALRHGREHANARITFFKPSMLKQSIRENFLMESAEAALEKEEFHVYLQPKVAPSDGSVVGAEALVRWVRNAEQFSPPSEFISLFEENGFIKKLDCYVFSRICRLLAGYKATGRKVLDLPVSVNFSRFCLGDAGYLLQLCDIADFYQIPRNQIELEITETLVSQFNDPAQLIPLMNNIKAQGFCIALDDFGCGYSSLNLLSKLPVDTIKFDKLFFDDMMDRDFFVISGFVDIAKKLNINVVVEGIETEDQVRMLQSVGIDIIQGYYYSKPLTICDFELFAEKNMSVCNLL